MNQKVERQDNDFEEASQIETKSGTWMVKDPLILDVGDDFRIESITKDILDQNGCIILNGYTPKKHYDFEAIYRDRTDMNYVRRQRRGTQLPHRDQLGDQSTILALYSPKTCTVHEREPFTYMGDREQIVDSICRFIGEKAVELHRGNVISRVKSLIPGISKRSTSFNYDFYKEIYEYVEKYGLDYFDAVRRGVNTLTWREILDNIYWNINGGASNSNKHNPLVEYLLAQGVIHLHKWQQNQTLIIDNERCMHGIYDPFEDAEMTDFILRGRIYNFEDEKLVNPMEKSPTPDLP
jgi:hypothetical protein